MQTILSAILSFLLSAGLAAQSYDLALGLRLGTEIGATAQLRLPMVHKNFVAEGIIHQSLNRDEGSLTVLGKQHQNLLSRRLNIFYGAGVHVGWTDEINTDTGVKYNRPWGIDGIVGAEATFARVNVSYDFKPAINIGGGQFPVTVQTGISVRYVLSKRHDIWDKKRERERRRDRRRRQRERDGKDPNGWRFWKKDGR